MLKSKKSKTWALVALGAFLLIFVYYAASSLGSRVFKSNFALDVKPDTSFAILRVYGTIQSGNKGEAKSGYDHEAMISYIDELIEDDSNKGIFLDIDSPGGTVYASDEMYLKLMDYKVKTGRPIQAYFRSMAASGGYYIGATADYITANRNCWTGSIGVIISTTNLKDLYDKLGIKEVLITSGRNKGMGSAGSELTEEQLAIYQGLVDESYNTFVEIVSNSRGMPIEDVKVLADGRIYTATQAVANGLIDKVASYEDAIAEMEAVTQTTGYHMPTYVPDIFESLFAQAEAVSPKSDMQALQESINSQLSGIPLYIYAPQ